MDRICPTPLATVSPCRSTRNDGSSARKITSPYIYSVYTNLSDKLQENNLAAVRILPKRFAELERNQPYVAFIGITPIAKG
jgi:hypothetical protein